MALCLIITACDKPSPRRGRLARKAGETTFNDPGCPPNKMTARTRNQVDKNLNNQQQENMEEVLPSPTPNPNLAGNNGDDTVNEQNSNQSPNNTTLDEKCKTTGINPKNTNPQNGNGSNNTGQPQYKGTAKTNSGVDSATQSGSTQQLGSPTNDSEFSKDPNHQNTQGNNNGSQQNVLTKGFDSNNPNANVNANATSNAPNQQITNSTLASDQVLQNFLVIMDEISVTYQEAWMSMTKDQYSSPPRFFDLVAQKIRKDPQFISMNEGQSAPTQINQQCDQYRLVQIINPQTQKRRLVYYNCSDGQGRWEDDRFQITFGVNQNTWLLTTTPQMIERILPSGTVGYLSFVPYKPICRIEVQSDGQKIKPTKIQCEQWGQVYSVKGDARSHKTILFNSILRDETHHTSSEDTLFEAKARYINVKKDSNLFCYSDVMKRTAPVGKEVIYVENSNPDHCTPLTNADLGLKEETPTSDLTHKNALDPNNPIASNQVTIPGLDHPAKEEKLPIEDRIDSEIDPANIVNDKKTPEDDSDVESIKENENPDSQDVINKIKHKKNNTKKKSKKVNSKSNVNDDTEDNSVNDDEQNTDDETNVDSDDDVETDTEISSEE